MTNATAIHRFPIRVERVVCFVVHIPGTANAYRSCYACGYMVANAAHERNIRSLVATGVATFADGFQARHLGEVDNPDGTINMKVHNVFIAALGPDIQYYTSLERSLDSSLGNMLETLAIGVAKLSFDVERHVAGHLSPSQTSEIARLLQRYKERKQKPTVADYANLASLRDGGAQPAKHGSDYYLFDPVKKTHHLIELKIGGDLDNKKARSEKEALLEQYAILANQFAERGAHAPDITIHFATAYNRYGEDKPWLQGRVRQFFADEELLIGRDFWNLITKADNGYEIVIDEYKRNAQAIVATLQEIRHSYLYN